MAVEPNREHRIPEEAAHSGQHLLGVVGACWDAEPVVRWTHKLAQNLKCPWTILYLEHPRRRANPNPAAIARNLALARDLGAEVINATDDKVVRGVLRAAAQHHATQIILAKPFGRSARDGWRQDRLLRRLFRERDELEIHAVPVGTAIQEPRLRQGIPLEGSPPWQYLKALLVVAGVTLAAFLFTPVLGSHATALIFLLTVVVLALFLDRGPTLMAAGLSAVLWDFFFLPPIYAFRIRRFEDAMLLGMYLVVALVLGHLTTRIRAQETAERRRQEHATALYLLTRQLNETADLASLGRGIVQQIQSTFKARAAVLLPGGENRLIRHAASTFQIPESEVLLADWVLHHQQRAGRFTHTSPSASALYLPLATSSGPQGVLALCPDSVVAPSLHQLDLLEAFADQIAQALDRQRLSRVSEQARRLAESERLSKTLLDSMSHEIRTPIAAIQGATDNLAQLDSGDRALQRVMIGEIQQATKRLDRLVGNILEVSRLESGVVRPRLNECDVSDLIHVALAETEPALAAHRVTVDIKPNLPVVRMDFVLTQQAIMNLLANAAAHTPPGTAVEVRAQIQDDQLLLTVADRGPGIPPEALPRLFDKFYRGPNAPTGGTGLGLSLVKGFVEAQGGHVSAQNRSGGGAVFNLALPLAKTSLACSEPTL